MTKVLIVQPNPGWQWEAITEACDLNKVTLFAANSCKEAEDTMGNLHPEVVVCALHFPDGDWRRILQAAQEATTPSNIIVVSEHEDIPLYMTALESGAYDFATLDTPRKDLSWLLRCTVENAGSRREAKRAAAISVSLMNEFSRIL
jgi:DNA-binding NtrC family response regulator